MLNTDLHSPSIKKKMTQVEFIHNNRNINNGKDLPSVFLEDLYQRILEDEIKTKVDHAFPKAIKRGYLLLEKKGFSNFAKKTQKYWFVLDKESKGLHYFKLETVQYFWIVAYFIFISLSSLKKAIISMLIIIIIILIVIVIVIIIIIIIIIVNLLLIIFTLSNF
jgi:hypothetical protein